MKFAKISRKLQPLTVEDLVRLGQDNDGGYLVDRKAVMASDILLSFGIADDWSFEEAFTRENDVSVEAYDGSIGVSRHVRRLLKSLIMVNKPYLFARRLKTLRAFQGFFRGKHRFHRAMVGAASDRSQTLANIVEAHVLGKYSHVFLKADIEGSEYRMLADLIRHADLLEGMAIEFHDVDVHVDKIIDFINRMPLKLCHVHANNSAGVAANGLPYLLELSFTRYAETDALPATVPHPLDQPSNPRQEDIEIAFID